MTDLYILPGLDGTARMLHDFIAAARPSFATVEAVAYPTDVVLGYRELETFARAALPSDTPFVLIGESFSGSVAISIAADPPPNVEYLKERNVARSPGRAQRNPGLFARKLEPNALLYIFTTCEI